MSETWFLAHYREADTQSFASRWPNFSPRELASKGEGELLIHADALDALQRLRDHLGINMNVTSAYRSVAHNAAVGGVVNSYHRRGMAFDVSMANHDPIAFEEAAKRFGFNGIGHYAAQGFMHIDFRSEPARWQEGGWFEAGETGLTPEIIPPKKPASLPEKIAAGTTALAACNAAIDQVNRIEIDWQTVAAFAFVLAVGFYLWRDKERSDL